MAKDQRAARHGYTKTGGPRCGAISSAASTRRLPIVSTIPLTMQNNHAGKNEPRMLTDGATPQPAINKGAVTAGQACPGLRPQSTGVGRELKPSR